MFINGIHRTGLWVLLAILTVTLLIFPTHLTFEYYAVQSTRIFDNLPLFGALFCIWLGVMLLLIFSRKNEEQNDWEKLALVCIFSAVFLGFWTIITRHGLSGEGIYHTAHVQYLNDTGNIPIGNKALAYFDFPGLHLIGSFVSNLCNLDPILASVFIVFSQALILATLLYALFQRLFNVPFVSSLAVLLIIQGNISLDKLNFFHPRNLGVILLVTFLLIIGRHTKEIFKTFPSTILLFIVATGAMMTHAITSFLFFFILLGIYFVQIINRERSFGVMPLILFIFLPLVWAMYWALITFNDIFATLPKVWSDLVGQGDIFRFILMLGKANIGEIMPFWANIARLFWWVVIYGFGSILGLWNLFRLKKLSSVERIYTGILLGIILLTSFSTIASVGGARFDSYILYGAFATVPVLLWFVLKLKKRIKLLALTSLILTFLILSFPTFLSHNNMVEFDAWHADQHATGNFLKSKFEKGGNLQVYGISWMNLLLRYYVPDIKFVSSPPVLNLKTESVLWLEMDNYIGSYEGQTFGAYIFLWNEKLIASYEHYFSLENDSPKWQTLLERLSKQNRIYDNNKNQMFEVVKG